MILEEPEGGAKFDENTDGGIRFFCAVGCSAPSCFFVTNDLRFALRLVDLQFSRISM